MRNWCVLLVAAAVVGCGDSAPTESSGGPDSGLSPHFGHSPLPQLARYSIQMTSAQEVPACSSRSKGIANFKVYSDGTIGSDVLITNRGSESVRFGHIHHLNPGQQTGPIIWWLSLPVGVDLNLTDAELAFSQVAVFVTNAHFASHDAGVAELLARPGDFYANFHSDACPGGFARGFLSGSGN
jgi:hypothetical protein